MAAKACNTSEGLGIVASEVSTLSKISGGALYAPWLTGNCQVRLALHISSSLSWHAFLFVVLLFRLCLFDDHMFWLDNA